MKITPKTQHPHWLALTLPGLEPWAAGESNSQAAADDGVLV